ncbi:MAG: hypothetical protein ACRCSG_05950, partial [Cellulosilyticaceae bacterium]
EEKKEDEKVEDKEEEKKEDEKVEDKEEEKKEDEKVEDKEEEKKEEEKKEDEKVEDKEEEKKEDEKVEDKEEEKKEDEKVENLTGTVSNGVKPVEDVKVTVYEELPNNEEKIIATNITDDKGRFSFSLEVNKTYKVEALLINEDNQLYYKKISSIELDKNKELELDLEQKYVIEVAVTDNRLVQIGGVQVRPVINGIEGDIARTNNLGKTYCYLLNEDIDEYTKVGLNVYYDNYGVNASSPELIYRHLEETIFEEGEFEGSIYININNALEKKINGVVRNEKGKLAKNVTVKLFERRGITEDSWIEKEVGEVKTNEKGKYSFDIPDNNTIYQVEVNDINENGNSVISDIVEARFIDFDDLVAKEDYVLNIEVKDKDGIPVKDAEVHLNNVSGIRKRKTDNFGKVAIYNKDWQPGKHIVEVIVDEGNEAKKQTKEIEIEIYEGVYKNNIVVEFDNLSVNKRLVTVKVDRKQVQVGKRNVAIEQVCIRGDGWEEYGNIVNGEAIIFIPKEYDDQFVEVVIKGELGVEVYKENIALDGLLINKTIEMSNVPRYILKGEILHDEEVEIPENLTIKIRKKILNFMTMEVASIKAVEDEFEQKQLVDGEYLVAIEYKNNEGKTYKNTEKVVIDKADKNITIEPIEVGYINVQVVDEDTEKAVQHISVGLMDNDLGITFEEELVNRQGSVTFKEGIKYGTKMSLAIISEDDYEIVSGNNFEYNNKNMSIVMKVRKK